MNRESPSMVYVQESVDFIVSAAQYCSTLESIASHEGLAIGRDKLLTICSYMYVRSLELPTTESSPFITLEHRVTEDQYESIRTALEQYFGGNDIFLDADLREMRYSEVPVSVSISESLSDVYQVLADTVWIYKLGVEENMMEALAEAKETFRYEWGSKLLKVMNRLHELITEGDQEWQEDE